VLQCGEDLVDADRLVAVRITGAAGVSWRVPESDIHHCQHVVHSGHAVVVAIANAGNLPGDRSFG